MCCSIYAGGDLRELATGKPFQYDTYKGDKQRNEQRYQEIAEVDFFIAIHVSG